LTKTGQFSLYQSDRNLREPQYENDEVVELEHATKRCERERTEFRERQSARIEGIRTNPTLSTRSGLAGTTGALNTMAGYEAMHMIRKGQIRWLAKNDMVGQVAFIHGIFGIAA
jgi:hypothetical protein